MTTFLRIVRSIQRERAAAGPDTTVNVAIERLLVQHGGLDATQVSKLSEALQFAETTRALSIAQE